MAPCLCLGPSGVGKTLLLKRLQSLDVHEGTSTVETVGSNIVHIPKKSLDPNGERQGRNEEVIAIREIGGSIAPLWPSYFSPDKLIVYVIDSSNLFQVSIATVLLMELLCHEKLTGAKILIVLSKIDLAERKKLNYLKFMMRLDTVVSQAGKRASLVEASSTTGQGVEEIRKWMVEHWPKPKTNQQSLRRR